MERINQSVYFVTAQHRVPLLIAGDLDAWRKKQRIRQDWTHADTPQRLQYHVRPATAAEIDRLRKLWNKSENLRKANEGKPYIVMTYA